MRRRVKHLDDGFNVKHLSARRWASSLFPNIWPPGSECSRSESAWRGGENGLLVGLRMVVSIVGGDVGRGRSTYLWHLRHNTALLQRKFDRCRVHCGNNSTVNRSSVDSRVAIFPAPSTGPSGGLIFPKAPPTMICSAGARGTCDMRQLRSLLRSTPSRIGRRLALIVAIAAASLPAAGA